jgi:hypothetical protein
MQALPQPRPWRPVGLVIAAITATAGLSTTIELQASSSLSLQVVPSTSTRKGRAEGHLRDEDGRPVAGAEIDMSVQALDGPGLAVDHLLTGHVPTYATRALVGLRVNTECDCTGESELTLFGVDYREPSDTAGRVPDSHFSRGLERWGLSGTGRGELVPSDAGQGTALRLSAALDQQIWLNSTEFVVSPGARFEATFSARIAPKSAGSGYFTVIFLGTAGTETSRVRLALNRGAEILTRVSNANGAFDVDLGGLPGSRLLLEARFHGNGALPSAVTALEFVPLASTLQLAPPAVALDSREIRTFSASVLDQLGNQMPDQGVAWGLSPPWLGTLGASGELTAGDRTLDGTITATSATLATSAAVSVKAAPVLSIGPPELLYSDAQLGPMFFDAPMCTLRRDSSTLYFWHSRPGLFQRWWGTLEAPMQHPMPDPDMDLNGHGYYVWIMNIYKVSPSDPKALLAFCHRESSPENAQFFIGLAKSIDGGASWKYLGDVIAPQDNSGGKNIGGAPMLVIDDHFYVYFNEFATGSSERRISVARAPLASVAAAWTADTTAPFVKYRDGSWDEDGLLGVGSNVIPGIQGSWDVHADAASCPSLGRYLLTVQTHSENNLWLFASKDGVSWGEKTLVDHFPGRIHAYSFFAGLSDASDDCSTVGDDFYIYFPRKDFYSSYFYDDFLRCRATVRVPAPSECTFAVAPELNSVAPGGGAFVASISTQEGCSWLVSPDMPWIHIHQGDTAGVGGAVSYNVEKNPALTARSGSIRIYGPGASDSTGRILTIIQDAASEAISPPDRPVVADRAYLGTSNQVSLVGAASSGGHQVEYQLDLTGDGRLLSDWGPTERSALWTVEGTVVLRARARCKTHPDIASPWSPGTPVVVHGTRPTIRHHLGGS